MLAATAFFVYGARDFRLDASSETLVLEGDKDLEYSRLISSRYGQTDLLVLAYTPKGDMFSDGTLADIGRLRDELALLDNVTSVRSILDVPLLESSGLSVKQLAGALPTLCSPTIDVNEARAELTSSPLYKNLLLSPDAKTTALLISMAGDEKYYELLNRRNSLAEKEDAGQLSAAERVELKQATEEFREYRDATKERRHQDIASVRKIMDRYRQKADLFLGGVSMIADDMITFIERDLVVFGFGVFFLLVLSLLAIFKRIRWVCISLLCCLISTVCMIGLLGWLGWEVTVVSANFVSLQLITTLSLAIHLVVRYREMLLQSPDADNHQLVLDTMLAKTEASVYCVLTTIAGFASLVFCDMLPVINFGWMMILGLAVSLIMTFLLFPAVLILLPKERVPRSSRSNLAISPIAGRLTANHGRLVVGAAALIMVLSAIGMSKLKVENSFINYFGKDTEIYRGMKVIDESLGGTTPLDVIVDFEQPQQQTNKTNSGPFDPPVDEGVFDEFEEFDQAAKEQKYWFTADKMSRIEAVQNYLESLPQVGRVVSLDNVLKVAEKLNKGKPLDSFELALLYSQTPSELKTLMIDPYVSTEHNEVRFWVRVRDSEKTLRRDDLLKKIAADLKAMPELGHAEVRLSGLMVLYNNMLQSLFSSQILTFGSTVLQLMVMFLILFRSVKISLIVMAPNVLPIAVVLGVMGWLDIPLDMMTITIAAIGLGIAVDNGTHYLHRFRDEIKNDHKYIPTMLRCHESTGHAMFSTSLTVIIGFCILGLSNFAPTVYFGLLTSLLMVMEIPSSLTLLPRLIIMIKPFGKEA